MEPSPLKRREIIDALRDGAVPLRGLELFAVGLGRFEKTLDDELDAVASGRGKFKAVRGAYGTGKTFFARWLEHRARQRGFATALVQINETETPLHRMETLYRRAVEGLQTEEWSRGAFRSLIEKWFFQLEEEVLASVPASDADAVAKAVGDLLERRLAVVSATQPQFSAALRAAHSARVHGDMVVAEGLIAWLAGQPNVGASIKRAANLKGELDHYVAGGFFRGLLEVLRQTGRRGLLLVMDEVETIQRIRSDSRAKSLNALRQLIDDLNGNQYPGLYVLITGTPQFFDGKQGVRQLQPLEQRLHTVFEDNPVHDSTRAIQIRLMPFDLPKLVEVGQRVRGIYPTEHPDRIATQVDDDVLRGLAEQIAGKLGGKVGIAPRIYLKRVVDLLDKVDQSEDYDVSRYRVALNAGELRVEERSAAGMAASVDDLRLDVGTAGGSDEGLG
jgi:hypothetical protein